MNLLAIALTPILIIVFYVYFKDKFEKESISFLFKNFLLGAFGSILISFAISGITFSFLPELESYNVFHQFLKAFFIVALNEEFSKYVIVRYYAQRSNEFNEQYDGIIYAVMVSMGFAAVENIMYVIEGGITTGIVRAFTAIPAHATFAIIMGYFMGKAKFSNQKWKWNLIGLLCAVIFHGAYDFFLFINFIPGISLGAFVSLAIGFWLSKKAIKLHQENSFFSAKE